MTEAAVASDIHQTLDVHRDVAAEIAFDVTVVFNFRAELLLFFLGEVFRAISILFSRGRSTPARRAIPCYLLAPWRCLWRGFLLHITRTTPWRLITLQYSHIGLTDGLTFIKCRPP